MMGRRGEGEKGRVIQVLVVIAALAVMSSAQVQTPVLEPPIVGAPARDQDATQQSQVSSGPSKPVTLPRRFRLDAGDVGYWIGAGADIGSSVGHRELNPLLRDSAGNFSVGKGVAFKGGLWGAVKAVEYFYPDHPKLMMWTKLAIGGAFVGAAVYNGAR